ncbi:hypothetical protein FRC07_013833 [Ceratobasidium sp. 392]|nr:hypothetical protein FRC07_013833 [Ceratobasidium sp. 392]
MASGPAKESSDTPWIAAAAIATIGGLAFIYSSPGNKTVEHHAAHATTPQKNAAKEVSKAKEAAPAEEPAEEPESKGDDDKSEVNANTFAVQESVKQSFNFDGDPASAKAKEAKTAKSKSDGDNSGSDSGDDFVKISAEETKDALKKENMDVPAIAKNDEEKQAKK